MKGELSGCEGTLEQPFTPHREILKLLSECLRLIEVPPHKLSEVQNVEPSVSGLLRSMPGWSDKSVIPVQGWYQYTARDRFCVQMPGEGK